MRVAFIPPSENEFRKLFVSPPLRRGGGFEDISVFYPGRRRGGSILSTISGMARKVLPFLFKALKPSAEEFGKGVLSDIITKERPLKESLKKHGVQAAKSAGLRILKGSGKIRRKREGRRRRCQRKNTTLHKNDVYNLL